MSKTSRKILSWLLTMALVLGLMPFGALGGIQAKADNGIGNIEIKAPASQAVSGSAVTYGVGKATIQKYEFNAEEELGPNGLQLDKKASVPENQEFASYFIVKGTGTIRGNSDTYSLEVAKQGGSYLEFTVTGTANVTIQVSSTSNSNTSAIGLKGSDGQIVENIENITTIKGSTKQTITYENLKADTYQVLAPIIDNIDPGTASADNPNGRGVRIYSVIVEEDTSGGAPAEGNCPVPTSVSAVEEDAAIKITWEGDECQGDGKYEVAVSIDGAEYKKISGSTTTEKTYTYTPAASGNYKFSVYGILGTQKSAEVESTPIDFTYPLAAPVVSATIGDGKVSLSWKEVKEATKYEVRTYLNDQEITEKFSEVTDATTITIDGLTNKTTYSFMVTAVRNTEKVDSEKIEATPKGTEGEFDAVPGMRIINQNGGLPLLITRNAGDITALQNATSGGFAGAGITNTGFLLTTDSYSGDFTVTADIKVNKQVATGTGRGIFLGAFTGAEEKDQLFTIAARNDGNIKCYYSKFTSGAFTNSATGSGTVLEGTFTVTRKDGQYTATYKSKDGSVSSATSSTESTGKVPISDALATGEVYLGIAMSGVEAEITNLKITANGTTIIDAATMTGSYAPEKTPWDEVAAPVLGTPALVAGDSAKIEVPWTMAVGLEGADIFRVIMYDANGKEVAAETINSSATEGSFIFIPEASGNYTFKGIAERENEANKESSEVSYQNFVLPIAKPEIIVMNAGGGSVKVSWKAVPEAASYKVEYKEQGAASLVLAAENITGIEYVIPSLTVGKSYEIIVTAVRGADMAASDATVIEVKDKVERAWEFAWFGTSTSKEANTVEVSPDKETITLNSCTIKADGSINKKGGKFMPFYDGISYYYTEVDPKKENFVLTATFHVDYLNPNVDGQEGFGIVVRDSIGEHGVNSSTFMTNSASIYATKIEGTVNGSKVSLKDGLGTRFTTGLTPELVSANETTGAKSKTDAFIWDPKENIKQGGDYTLTMKKTNTGFHAVLNHDESNEIIMYDNYCEKLTVLDEEKIYVGFAAARGCNVTITDISFTTTDPATDPAAIPEPKETIDPSYRVTSPTTFGSSDYKLVFESNADGKVIIKKGSQTVEEADVLAGEALDYNTTLSTGQNQFEVTFTPTEGFETADGAVLSTYETKTQNFTVTYRDISTSTNTIYVTPDGKSSGKGTKASPLDIYTAVAYAKAGQTIVLKDGTYHMTGKLKVARGVDGTEAENIVMMSEKGGRAILDFAGCRGNFEMWGSYWHVYGIDVCNTDGNIKGIQVAGHHNIFELVNTYKNGDTGLQVSGTSNETKDKWPSYNLILNCISYDNCDPGFNNADGFAAKLTCGEGNVFRGCIAYNNLDDGWDLYSKVESGPIGVVTIENCLAYRNGTILDGSASGDGNGFKLGGDGIAVPHILKNCISYENDANGITSNSDPAIVVINNTSVGNKGTNYSLYGKGSTPLTFVAENNISYKGSSTDSIGLASLYNATNYFDGINTDGEQITDSMFVSVDTSILPDRKEDGSIDMHGLFELGEGAPSKAGATSTETPGSGSELTYEIVEGNQNNSNSGSSDSSDSDDDSSSGNTSSVSSVQKPVEDTGDTTGNWIKDSNGWWYQKADATYPANGWLKIKAEWYLFNGNGYMQTGWQKAADNKWYYLDINNGEMKTGWIQPSVNGEWYFLDLVNGDMRTGWIQVDSKWYFLDLVNGNMRTGWIQTVDGKWYYLYADGSCAINTITPDGYKVDENGAWVR